MKKNFFLLLAVLLSMSALTTTAHELDPTSHQANIVPSAEAWAMSRYGNPTPSLYTGAMSYSVPIYTYKDPDFTIPVSLDYHFDGYKLTARSGSVGMGWFLNCGGIITREVVGLPDEECVATSMSNPNYFSGYYYMHKGQGNVFHNISSYENSFYSGSDGFDLMCSSAIGNTIVMQYSGFSRYAGKLLSCNTPLLINTNISSPGSLESFDFSSDIYHFSMLGISGDFVLGPDNHVYVYNSTVPYGELTVQCTKKPKTMQFEIRTRDGHIFTFGANSNEVDYSCDALFERKYENNEEYTSSKQHFSSFKLDSITAPNGRKVKFEYDNTICELVCKKVYRPRINGSDYCGNDAFVTTTSAVAHVLTEVKIGNNSIFKFKYVNKTKEEDNVNAFISSSNCYQSGMNMDPSPSCLSEIQIHDRDNELIERVTLVHNYTSSDNNSSPKMFLKSVTTNTGKTSFDFKHMTKF